MKLYFNCPLHKQLFAECPCTDAPPLVLSEELPALITDGMNYIKELHAEIHQKETAIEVHEEAVESINADLREAVKRIGDFNSDGTGKKNPVVVCIDGEDLMLTVKFGSIPEGVLEVRKCENVALEIANINFGVDTPS